MTTRQYDKWKRSTDVGVALLMLIATAPIQAAAALAIAARIGRPVLFRQVRVGRAGETFVLVKFRTMVPADASRDRTTDADRLTGLGRLLRSASLDELPALWNVIRGDMSLVGPRPLLVQYLPRYSQLQNRRHEVRPGLTGLAQVSGRNGIPWERKLALDVAYVDQRSWALDLRILLKTVATVLSRDGICAPGSATMPEFRAPSDVMSHG